MSRHYLQKFFRETDKVNPDEIFTVTVEGEANIMSYQVVLESLMVAPAPEQVKIANIIRKIDYLDGDIPHFLRHLGECMARVRLDQLAGSA